MFDHELAKIILDEVANGCKAVELVAAAVGRAAKSGQSAIIENYEDTVNGLLERGDIVEVEYSLPSMDYRSKSFYLPRGTRVTCREWDGSSEGRTTSEGSA